MIVQADNVWKKFGRFSALQGLSFSVPEGKMTAAMLTITAAPRSRSARR